MSSGMLHSLVTRKYLFISVKFPIAPHSHPNRKVCDLQKYRLGIWGSRLSSFSLGPHPQVSRPGRVRQKLSRFTRNLQMQQEVMQSVLQVSLLASPPA